MFVIHVSFINITLSLFTFLFINIVLSLFTCFMSVYFKEVDLGKNCVYPRVLSLYETVISIYALLYDPNGATVMTQTGTL